MACYYIVISSTHLSNGHFRNIKGVFRGPLCKNGNKTLDYAEKEKAITKALEDLKANFYCELCDKQYYKHQEFDNHINSYDHAHKQRLKELKQREFARNVASKSRKDEKKQEKALKRLHELAELRKQVRCAPGSGPMFKSTTVAVKNPPGKNHPCTNLVTEGPDSKATDPECGMAGNTLETGRGTNKSPASCMADVRKVELCKLGKQIRGQKVGFSFSFPKKVPVKLESSAAVFCENSEEGAGKKNAILKHKINGKTSNIQTGTVAETAVDLASNKHQQQNNGHSVVETLLKEVPQELAIKGFDYGIGETTNLSSCVSQVQCRSKPKLPMLVSVPSMKQDTLQKEVKATENAMMENFGPNEDVAVSSQVINSFRESEGSTPSDELTQRVHVTGETLNSLPEIGCSEKQVAEITARGMQNNPCLCRRPDAPFFPVISKDESTVLQWPSEMLHFTSTQPSITFCCNPLYFDFRSSKSKGCAEEIRSKANDLETTLSSQKEPRRPCVNAKGDFLNSCSDMNLNISRLNAQDIICNNETYHAGQKNDLDVCNKQVVGLKHRHNGTEQEASIREIISYCKPKKFKKHRRSSRHLRHKRRKHRTAGGFKHWRGEGKQIHLCKKMKRSKISGECRSRKTSEVGEGSSSSGPIELSGEEHVIDSDECKDGHGKMSTENSEGSPGHFEDKFDQSNKTSEKLDIFWKNIDCDAPKRNTLKNKCIHRICNTNNEAEGKRAGSDAEFDAFPIDNETKTVCRQQKTCSLARNPAGDSSSDTCLHKRKQRRAGNGYNSFSDVEYSDQLSDERHSCQNHSKKRRYASLNGEAGIIYRKRCRYRYSLSPHKDHKQRLNSPHRRWSQVGSSSVDFNHKNRKESRQEKQQCQARHNLKSNASERGSCLTSDGLLPCYPSLQDNTWGVSAPNDPGKDKNMISVPPSMTEERYTSMVKPSMGCSVGDVHSKANNQLLDRPVSKITPCDMREVDVQTESRLSEMWINRTDPTGDVLLPRLSFVLEDSTEAPHSEQEHNQGLLQKDGITQKQADPCGDTVKDIKASLNEVFLCRYEAIPKGCAEGRWLQGSSNIPHSNAQQKDAMSLTGNRPQKSEQLSKPFSPLSQTISFAPEEIEKYRQLQMQAQQHIEQQKLDSRVKAPSSTAVGPMQPPVPRQQSVTTASITTIHRSVLQRHPATASMTTGSFIQPHLQSLPHIHPLPPHLTHISLAHALYPGGPPTFLAAPQLHIIPACALQPDHFALHPLPAAALFPPLLTLHTPAIPLHHFLNSTFATQDFLHLTGAPT
ncbi:zinc finger protein 804A [Leucoraja erinacea]|uniref:zinc finger protein 804A n=1 Tax=Leucoraja erinaceus TaxID=7782 RepID=UPI002456592E|nr:zinc finger protein 804A [Leucoraja erinacea]